MKIAVCVKQVPDATVHKRIDPATNRLDRSGEAALNPTDLNAVEEALRIRDASGGEVVLVSLGPDKAIESLRKALAMGADRAVLVTDEAAAGSDLLGTSYALAKALEREGADLVLFGQASNDADGAVLWAAVAEHLRLPVVSQVAGLTITDGAATGKRQTEHGYDVIRAPLPGGRRRLGRDQRAALPVAQGDHGSEVEAAGDGRPRRHRRRAGASRRGRREDDGPRALAAAVAQRPGQARGRRDRCGEDPRVPHRAEADL